MLITWLDPQPPELPRVFPSPFDDLAPHPLAQHCAELVKAGLRSTGLIAPGVPTSVLTRTEGGKMFGVLVVKNAAGRVGFLRAVMPATAGMSGMNYKREFLPFDLVGAVSWASLCVYGGYKLGERAETIVHQIGWVAGGAVVVGGLLYLLKKRLTSRL